MPARINPNYCVACNKWEWDEELVMYGVYYYHQSCLNKLLAGLTPLDNKTKQRLGKAFNRLLGKE